eukprot:m.173140 g.173140  ORF g.173140 m.173140 type:complete len:2129 (-) comp17311_c0_seq3:152-6538(-)
MESVDATLERVAWGDREAALRDLVAGTRDYYMYNARVDLAKGNFAAADKHLKEWKTHIHGSEGDAEYVTLQHRLQALRFEKGSDADKKSVLEYFVRQLGVDHSHTPQSAGFAAPIEENQAPSTADLPKPNDVLSTFLSQYPSDTSFLSERGLQSIVNPSQFNDMQLNNLMYRIQRPDHPLLLQLAARSDFGSIPIHQQLTLEQLDSLLARTPALINNEVFLQCKLRCLLPDQSLCIDAGKEKYEEALIKCRKFVDQLSPAFNSMKASVYFKLLTFQSTELGKYDEDTFISYVKLPKHSATARHEYTNSPDNQRVAAHLGYSINNTDLPPISDDTALVNDFLLHLFSKEARTSFKPLDQYLAMPQLQERFAEAKLMAGQGDAAKMQAMIRDASQLENLRQEVVIKFEKQNPSSYRLGEPVVLGAAIKNVQALVLKVFEINALNFYEDKTAEVPSSINLDGLIPTLEKTFQYPLPPIIRHVEQFALPELQQAQGVFVVELVGSGYSARAVIRKGVLSCNSRVAVSGHVFQVVDERNEILRDAYITLLGQRRTFKADERGEITIPFAQTARSQPIVLSRGNLHTLTQFQHMAESYELSCAWYVDNEALVSGNRNAQLLVCAGLFVNGTRVTTRILKDVQLMIVFVDKDDVETAKTFPNIQLADNEDFQQVFAVPEAARRVTISLTAKVDLLSRSGETQSLRSESSFAINTSEASSEMEALHLRRRSETDYELQVLGKSGEPRPRRPVNIQAFHPFFVEYLPSASLDLATDENGIIKLNGIVGYSRLTASVGSVCKTWTLQATNNTYPTIVHGHVGETLAIPVRNSHVEMQLSLLATRTTQNEFGSFIHDCSANLKVTQDGYITIENLAAGNYSLAIYQGGIHHVGIRVSAVPPAVLGPLPADAQPVRGSRRLENVPQPLLQITRIDVAGKEAVVTLAGASDNCRVHALCPRFVTGMPLAAFFSSVCTPIVPKVTQYAPARSEYLDQEKLGDEQRYILERRAQPHLPGNMLKRPCLILVPKEISSSETKIVNASNDMRRERCMAMPQSACAASRMQASDSVESTCLDFLRRPLVMAANLKPDQNGQVRIPLEAIGAFEAGVLEVVAVDSWCTVERHATIGGGAAPSLVPAADLRQRATLDPTKHYTEKRDLTVVGPADVWSTDSASSTRLSVVDSQERLYSAFTTLLSRAGEDAKAFAQFSFLGSWGSLAPEQKLKHYSEFACHEFNFFVFCRDPAFFEAVVKPFIANKTHKDLVDLFLLGQPLDAYLSPVLFNELNVFEQCLLASRYAGSDTGRGLADYICGKGRFEPMEPSERNRRFDSVLLSSEELAAADSEGGAGQPPEPLVGGAAFGGAGGGGGGGRDFDGFAAAPQMMPMMASDECVAAPMMFGAPPGAMAFAAAAPAPRAMGMMKMARSMAPDSMSLGAVQSDMANRARKTEQLFRPPENVKEHGERQYYTVVPGNSSTQVVRINAFWCDFARYVQAPVGEFLPLTWTQTGRTFTEAVLAMALLPLPFANSVEYSRQDLGLQIKVAKTAYVLSRRVREAAATPSTLVVHQNFLETDNQFVTAPNGNTTDRFVTAEFLPYVSYLCRLVVTNVSSTTEKLSLFMQIPEGSLPLMNTSTSKTTHVELGPYATTREEIYFYFPTPGRFGIYPAQAAREDTICGFAEPFAFNVVPRLNTIDTKSWADVADSGTREQVVQFLQNENLFAVDLYRIAWRMKKKDVYEATLAILRQRRFFSPPLWGYAFLHSDLVAIREFMEQHRSLFGPDFSCALLAPSNRSSYAHTEFSPVVNARAHRLGKNKIIPNPRIAVQYNNLLKTLSFHNDMPESLHLAVVYHLLLQDRVVEAKVLFDRLSTTAAGSSPAGSCPLQRDYLQAYFAFFGTAKDLAQARKVAEQYRAYPVLRWREMFLALLAQIDEIETGQVQDKLEENRVLSSPSMNFEIKEDVIAISQENLAGAECTVQFFVMDVELLFSTTPFVMNSTNQFSYVKPNLELKVKLDGGKAPTKVPLPEQFRSANVVVQVLVAGLRQSANHFAHNLNCQIAESQGHLRLTRKDTGAAIPCAYVKVYCKANGADSFYKDGYTDLRGRFDYATLNTREQLNAAQSMAILVMSPECGALIREVKPPTGSR